jgi:hypothetical protein
MHSSWHLFKRLVNKLSHFFSERVPYDNERETVTERPESRRQASPLPASLHLVACVFFFRCLTYFYYKTGPHAFLWWLKGQLIPIFLISWGRGVLFKEAVNSYTICRRINGWEKNQDLEKDLEGSGRDLLEVLFWHLRGRTQLRNTAVVVVEIWT